LVPAAAQWLASYCKNLVKDIQKTNDLDSINDPDFLFFSNPFLLNLILFPLTHQDFI